MNPKTTFGDVTRVQFDFTTATAQHLLLVRVVVRDTVINLEDAKMTNDLL